MGKKADIKYPFEHVEDIKLHFGWLSIHPVTKRIHAPFLTLFPERKEIAQGFHHEANGDFKTVIV